MNWVMQFYTERRGILARYGMPKYIFDKNFRYQTVSFWYSCNQLVFEREIFTHQRTVFERK